MWQNVLATPPSTRIITASPKCEMLCEPSHFHGDSVLWDASKPFYKTLDCTFCSGQTDLCSCGGRALAIVLFLGLRWVRATITHRFLLEMEKQRQTMYAKSTSQLKKKVGREDRQQWANGGADSSLFGGTFSQSLRRLSVSCGEVQRRWGTDFVTRFFQHLK